MRYVYANGKAVRSQAATVKWVQNTHRSKPRISVVVSKKVLKSAVGRNRIRRRIYEYMRTRLSRLDDVYDIVIIVTTPDFRTMSGPELLEQLDGLFDKAEIFRHE